MSKRSITDFFKPFAFPRENNRLIHDEGSEEPRPSPSQRSRTNTPQPALGPIKEQSRSPFPPNSTVLTSSQGSGSSSLHGLPPSTPEEQLSQLHERTPTVRRDENGPIQSFAEAVTASQVPILSSSQRAIRNGEVVIRDSDDERSDTDVSLDDLDDIIASHRPPLASAPSSGDRLPLLPSPRVTRSKTPRNDSKGRSRLVAATAKQEATQVAIPKFRIPLEALIQQRQADDRTKLSLKNAKYLLDSLEERTPAAFAAGSAMLDEDLLATVIKDEVDGSGMEKLLGAIERTEALDLRKTWSFFSQDNERVDVESLDGPPVTDRHWKSIFAVDSRISGHAKLRRVLDIYEAVAGSLVIMGNQMVLNVSNENPPQDEPGNRGIVNNYIIFGKIEDIMSAIVDGMSEEGLDEELAAALTLIYHSVEDLGLQLQLLRHLPASSSRLNLLRRRLASAFFFHDQAYLSKEKVQLADFRAIVHRLNKPQFDINRETNYPSLAASIAILAIGLDSGNPPPPDAGKNVESAFNDNVDVLAQRIKAMFTQIVDTGASHVKRTEAKEVLESFHSCLVYAIRTKQKPRGMIWGNNAETEKQKTMMNDFACTQ
ncbi:MAG: hypothetical protein LQ343_003254 [Gyalolechia ehrenbergii]|nr:MAG: hypothetical protein LQ343_003254 [Gyalolechia ehrenbergii]